MRLLVVGAGASYAEAQHAGLPEELRPPLIKNFAARMWSDYNPHFLLSAFLRHVGYDPGDYPLGRFVELEKVQSPKVNVERFFEYAYSRRDFVVQRHES